MVVNKFGWSRVTRALTNVMLDACFRLISIKTRLTSFNQKSLQCVNAILTKTWSQKGFTSEAVLWSVTNGYDLQSGIQSNSFSPVTFVIIPDVLVKHLITKLCLSSLYAMAYQTMLAGIVAVSRGYDTCFSVKASDGLYQLIKSTRSILALKSSVAQPVYLWVTATGMMVSITGTEIPHDFSK